MNNLARGDGHGALIQLQLDYRTTLPTGPFIKAGLEREGDFEPETVVKRVLVVKNATVASFAIREI